MRDSQQEQSEDIRESGPTADVADDAGLIRGDSGEGGFAAKKTPNSFLYFIQCTGPGGPIKIGHTKVVERRLSALQMGCPWALTLIGHVAVDDGVAIEEQLHYRFAKTRVRGEWFAATAELLDLASRADRYRARPKPPSPIAPTPPSSSP